MFKYLLCLTFCFAAPVLYAQNNLKGRVLENKTRVGLAGIRINNLANKQTTVTDNNGRFTIKAGNGDLLALKGFAYKNDTVLVTSLAEQEIFIDPETNQLGQVDVVSTNIKQMPKYYDPQFHGQTVVYHRDREGNINGGITMRMWYWKKDAKKKAKLEAKLKEFDTMDRINEIFTPETIGHYVPLTGTNLDDFIALYRPSVKEFNKNDFNLVDYLNASYKKYAALPEDKRHPKPLVIN